VWKALHRHRGGEILQEAPEPEEQEKETPEG
jgi:hypothetical protein